MNEQRLYDILGQDLEVPDIVNKKVENAYSRLKENRGPAKRKGARPVRTALIAAVAAVACVLCMAAAMPARVFSLASGATAIFQQISLNRSTAVLSGAEPLELEDERLWLVVNGERTDITDQIDMDTPYIYDNTDPNTGCRDYLVVGGTPEDYGWIEFHELEDEGFVTGGAGGNVCRTYYVEDGTTYDFVNDLTEEQRTQIDQQLQEGHIEPSSVYTVWAPWFVNANENLIQLGVPDFVSLGAR